MEEPNDKPRAAVDEPLSSAATLPENVADPTGRKLAVETLRRGPYGAVVLASICVLCVLIIWYAFYLFVYVPRT